MNVRDVMTKNPRTVASIIEESYRMVATKKQLAVLNG